MSKVGTAGTENPAPAHAQRLDLYEVLIQDVTGHRTIRRVDAESEAAAVKAVKNELDPGTEILGSAPAGRGLGSGDE